jgi:hypothetical protein
MGEGRSYLGSLQEVPILGPLVQEYQPREVDQNLMGNAFGSDVGLRTKSKEAWAGRR